MKKKVSDAYKPSALPAHGELIYIPKHPQIKCKCGATLEVSLIPQVEKCPDCRTIIFPCRKCKLKSICAKTVCGFSGRHAPHEATSVKKAST